MFNAKQKEAIKRMYQAAGDFLSTFGVFDEPVVTDTKAEEIEDRSGKELVQTTSEKGVNGYSRAELDAMGYNSMKTLAKKLGLSAKGDKDAILEMLLTETPPEKTSDEEEKTETTTAPKNEGKKSATVTTPRGKKVSAPEPEPEDTEDEDDGIEAMVIEATKDMSDEELLDYLLENGIKAKGKRQALIAITVKSVRNGDLEISDEDEEDTSESDNEDENESEEFDLDEINDTNNPDMTEERAAAIEAMSADIDSQYKKKEINKKDLIEFIDGYFSDKDHSYHSYGLSEKDLLKMYKDLVYLYINDEGEMPEEDAEPEVYTVNGNAFCCGHPCEWDEDEEQYVCSQCGGKYSPEE